MTRPKTAKTKRANPTDIELAQQIARLEGITVKGFESVEEHFKVLNGRVGKHDNLFAQILGDEKFQSGTKNGIGISWRVFIALATIALGVLAVIYGPR